MKLITLILYLSSVVSWGSGTRWATVHLPTHVLFVDEGPSGGVTEVPYVTSTTGAFESRICQMNSTYIPHHVNWNIPADTNLITLYRLSISMAIDTKSDPKNPKRIIVIDCTNAARPKGYPFSVDEVVKKVKACVKLNFNSQTIKVRPKREKEGKQGSAEHPPTATNSKSETEDKPKSEPKGCPQ